MAVKKNTGTRGLKAVILVGGLGTRLRPLTDNKPKPILPVVNLPFLERTIIHLKEFGIKDLILAMSYLPDEIRKYFKDGERCGVKLTYCLEKDPLGTAGAVKNAETYLDGPFVVLNGDNVFLEMDFAEAFAFHSEKKARATIFLTRVDNPDAYGVVETDDEGRVKRFVEKPPPGTETSNWINAGGYILEPEVLKYIPSGQHYMFEKGLFPKLLELGEPVFGYSYPGYWLDMGTPMKYFLLNMHFLEKSRQDKIPNGDGVVIHPSAVIKSPCVIDNGCRIGRDVCIKGPVIIGQDCVLEDNVSIENAVLWDNVSIGAGARLSRCIVASNVIIGDNLDLENRVITPSENVPLK
jgi:mannose-1-phosphate guanylyltransferase